MRSDRYTEKKVHKKRKKSRVLKVLLLLIFLLLIAIPSTVYYLYNEAKESLHIETKEDIKVSVGSPLPATDCIADYTGNLFFETGESSYSIIGSHEPVSYDDFYMNTDTIGEHSVSGFIEQPVIGGRLAPYKTFNFTYNVVDDIPPVMLWSGDGAVVERGTTFEITSVVGYGDNADPEPKIEYEGKVDTSKNGSYPLHITVTDASGNSIDWDATIVVADSLPSYSDSSEKYPFSSFKKTYAADGRHFGIDVSSWQSDIDFNKVKAAGCEFAVIRAGYSIDGFVEIDSKFKQNLKRAKEAGVPIGLYLYSYDNTEEKARSSARWLIDQLGGEKIDYPVAFDWEDFGQFQTYKMSFIGLNKMYDAFADELESAGYDCMLYGSKNYLEKIWTDTDTRPIWLAHYTDQTDYKGPYRIWQASSSGRIDGIDGAVDMNIMYD